MTINKLYLETQLMQSSGKGTIDLTSKRIKIDMVGQIRAIKDMTLTNIYSEHYPEDLVDKEQAELDIIALYLPEPLSEVEVMQIIEETITVPNP